MLLRRRHVNKDEKIKVEKVDAAEVENVTVKEPKVTPTKPTKKPLPVKKKVTKNDNSK